MLRGELGENRVGGLLPRCTTMGQYKTRPGKYKKGGQLIKGQGGEAKDILNTDHQHLITSVTTTPFAEGGSHLDELRGRDFRIGHPGAVSHPSQQFRPKSPKQEESEDNSAKPSTCWDTRNQHQITPTTTPTTVPEVPGGVQRGRGQLTNMTRFWDNIA